MRQLTVLPRWGRSWRLGEHFGGQQQQVGCPIRVAVLAAPRGYSATWRPQHREEHLGWGPLLEVGR